MGSKVGFLFRMQGLCRIPYISQGNPTFGKEILPQVGKIITKVGKTRKPYLQVGKIQPRQGNPTFRQENAGNPTFRQGKIPPKVGKIPPKQDEGRKRILELGGGEGRKEKILPKVGKILPAQIQVGFFPTLGRMGIGFLQGRKSTRQDFPRWETTKVGFFLPQVGKIPT